MNGEVKSECTPSYRFLTEEQIDHFHNAISMKHDKVKLVYLCL